MRSSEPDLELLDKGSTAVLGYFVHTWYRHYVAAVSETLHRLHNLGIIEGLSQPTQKGRHALFDFGALDEEKLAYLLGIYFHVQTCHKAANYRLMQRYDGPQVLYLRGYDVEGSLSTGGDMAAGFSTMHTQSFGKRLAELFGDDTRLFKVLSPKDVYWETVSTQRYFRFGYDELIQWVVAHRPCSVYLNAHHWQEGVLDLLDRMDHYVVYVSSNTASLRWELVQLDADGRRDRVTVVLDSAALEATRNQLGLQEGLRSKFGEQVIWSGHSAPLELTDDELSAWIAERFLVVTPEQLERDLDRHRSRIAASRSPLRPGQRETWFDFDFRPALEESEVTGLHSTSVELLRLVDNALDGGIECLPLTLTHLQLRIYATLLMGDHLQAGRALGSYAGVMGSALEYYEPEVPRIAGLSAHNRDSHLGMLRQHLALSEYVGVRFLASGRSHEFGDYSAEATATFNLEVERAHGAASRFFSERGGPFPSR